MISLIFNYVTRKEKNKFKVKTQSGRRSVDPEPTHHSEIVSRLVRHENLPQILRRCGRAGDPEEA
jgi:hypothetical protein